MIIGAGALLHDTHYKPVSPAAHAIDLTYQLTMAGGLPPWRPAFFNAAVCQDPGGPI